MIICSVSSTVVGGGVDGGGVWLSEGTCLFPIIYISV